MVAAALLVTRLPLVCKSSGAIWLWAQQPADIFVAWPIPIPSTLPPSLISHLRNLAPGTARVLPLMGAAVMAVKAEHISPLTQPGNPLSR